MLTSIETILFCAYSFFLARANFFKKKNGEGKAVVYMLANIVALRTGRGN